MLNQGVHYSCLQLADKWRKLLQRTFPAIKGAVPEPLCLHVPQGSFGKTAWRMIDHMVVGTQL
jgi:hypothetical protein